MKKVFFLLFVLIATTTFSQKENTEKRKDTVKTEVVNVVSSYTPTIADASKISKKPKIKLAKSSQKRKMEYSIFSAPVASTFIPKSGAVKGINVGIKEKLFSNYAALGFGNFTSPYAELFLHNHVRFNQEYGLSLKYNGSLDENSIESSFLNSNFYNFDGSIFYGQRERILTWKVIFNTERNVYNWYGLPDFFTNENLQNSINEEQRYNFFELIGDVAFENSFVNNSVLKVSYFADAFESKELFANLSADISVPLRILNSDNDLKIKTSLEFLSGEFQQNYERTNNINYSLFTASVQPNYTFSFQDIKVKAGFQLFASLDTENSTNNFLIYPDVEISAPIIRDYFSVYGGASGGLNTNTYKDFSDENPFVSPTLFITQTSQKYNYFAGTNGRFTRNVNFNIRGSYQLEEDKPLFIRNNSKSDGITANNNLNGYEYGNSFSVFYDDVQTFSVFAEIEYAISERINIGTSATFNNYTVKNSQEAWNLPDLTANVFGKYRRDKWYVESALFYVGERKDINYTTTFPSGISPTPQTIDGYLDLNLSGGYHIGDRLSAFVKLNNILNTDYQRFQNFNVQGFQVMGGFTYKFDF